MPYCYQKGSLYSKKGKNITIFKKNFKAHPVYITIHIDLRSNSMWTTSSLLFSSLLLQLCPLHLCDLSFLQYRITFCSLGVFHTVGVSLLLIMAVLYLLFPCRDAPPLYYPASTCSGSVPQKVCSTGLGQSGIFWSVTSLWARLSVSGRSICPNYLMRRRKNLQT